MPWARVIAAPCEGGRGGCIYFDSQLPGNWRHCNDAWPHDHRLVHLFYPFTIRVGSLSRGRTARGALGTPERCPSGRWPPKEAGGRRWTELQLQAAGD